MIDSEHLEMLLTRIYSARSYLSKIINNAISGAVRISIFSVYLLLIYGSSEILRTYYLSGSVLAGNHCYVLGTGSGSLELARLYGLTTVSKQSPELLNYSIPDVVQHSRVPSDLRHLYIFKIGHNYLPTIKYKDIYRDGVDDCESVDSIMNSATEIYSLSTGRLVSKIRDNILFHKIPDNIFNMHGYYPLLGLDLSFIKKYDSLVKTAYFTTSFLLFFYLFRGECIRSVRDTMIIFRGEYSHIQIINIFIPSLTMVALLFYVFFIHEHDNYFQFMWSGPFSWVTWDAFGLGEQYGRPMVGVIIFMIIFIFQQVFGIFAICYTMIMHIFVVKIVGSPNLFGVGIEIFSLSSIVPVPFFSWLVSVLPGVSICYLVLSMQLDD